MQLNSGRSSNDFNNLNEWHLAIPGDILIKLNKEENENNERYRNIHKPQPLQLNRLSMNIQQEDNIDDQTIMVLGLRRTYKHINAQTALSARVFEYPDLEEVYIMESDLYGNKMPKGLCFLAFNGQHGLIGKQVKIETLRTATVADIKQMVQANNDG